MWVYRTQYYLRNTNEVKALEIIDEKVNLINQRKSPIVDKEIEEYLANKELNLLVPMDKELAYQNTDFVVIATPTNYDEKKNFFNTTSVESVIEDVLAYRPDAPMIIKSTIPVGYTKHIREKYGVENIIFSPECLREGKAVYDNLYPSRIIVGEKTEKPKRLLICWLRVQLKKIFPYCSWTPLKRKLSNYSQILTWHCE